MAGKHITGVMCESGPNGLGVVAQRKLYDPDLMAGKHITGVMCKFGPNGVVAQP